MDEMKIQSAFLRNIVSRIIKRLIKDKLSLDVDLAIHDLNIRHEEDTGKFTFDINVGGSLRANELKDFLDVNDII